MGIRPIDFSKRLRTSLTSVLLFCASFALAACISPQESGVKVIVGAKLQPGAGQPTLEHSVVVIADGKIRAVGPQSSTPVPKGAEIISGAGMTIRPMEGESIQPGQPADLVLKDSAERVMRHGEWVQ